MSPSSSSSATKTRVDSLAASPSPERRRCQLSVRPSRVWASNHDCGKMWRYASRQAETFTSAMAVASATVAGRMTIAMRVWLRITATLAGGRGSVSGHHLAQRLAREADEVEIVGVGHVEDQAVEAGFEV